MVKIETFECLETSHEPVETTEEARGIIEALGLDGQAGYICPEPKSGRETRNPYRQMNKDENFVYSVLCPKHESVEKYAQSPIPLRVLQVLAHAKALGFFDKFQIWDHDDSKTSDPVLVGVKSEEVGTKPHTWTANRFYILARWGEELEAMVVLMRKALDIRRERLMRDARAAEAKIKAFLAGGVSDDQIIEHGPGGGIYVGGI